MLLQYLKDKLLKLISLISPFGSWEVVGTTNPPEKEADDLSPKKYEQLQIEVWLNEYQSCYRNINHYDSIRWTIGSIFIGASLALFSLSLGKALPEVLFAFAFSFSLIMIWYLYAQHVNHYVMGSIVRMHEIEQALRKRKFEIKLQKSIHELENKLFLNPKGTQITLWLFSSVTALWVFNIAFSAYDFFKEKIFETEVTSGAIIVVVIVALVLPSILIMFWKMHKKFNPIPWGEKIDDVLKS